MPSSDICDREMVMRLVRRLPRAARHLLEKVYLLAVLRVIPERETSTNKLDGCDLTSPVGAGSADRHRAGTG
jgi:hypothetical protein